ncbi:transporter substrate-binding domain-containing protein [Paenibacillus sp. HJL G12]|uniref:Transporter substrate-binding domain-containing protein n=1 Tax=Paenibacillus dendrobii TaxID=2691084 RepID=A0A7X3IKW3_9BACL|nr:ABC transporter substrate-binding protein [Paenibacillus dendrobii]MWV43907.1 transporter substrate-binding domain-containing protein [Paenibacillus dendrobii]
MKKRSVYGKIFGMAGSLVLAAALTAGCGGKDKSGEAASGAGQKEQVQEIKVGYVNLLAAAPAIIAKEKDLLGKQGLKAEFFSFANGPDLYKALSSGKLDVAYAGMPAAVNWGSRGAEFKIIAKVDDGKNGVLTKPSSGIQQPADLKGKKIGNLVKGSGVDYLIRAVLLPEGQLSDQDVTLVQMETSNMESAITNGTIDAAVAGEPFLTFAELRGLKVVKELPDPAFVVLGSNSFLKDHADTAKKFIQGHIASIEDLNQNTEADAEVLAKAFNVPEIKGTDKTYTPAEVMAQALKRNQFSYQLSDEDLKYYQEIADNSYKIKSLEKPLEVSTIIDTTWIK